MQSRKFHGRKAAAAAVSLFCALITAACGRNANPSLGTFQLGEKVQVGSATYTPLSAEWRASLSEGGPAPQPRFLFVSISVTNNGGSTLAFPMFELKAADGTKHREMTQNMEGVHEWMGIFRSVEPSQTTKGVIVFDVPIAAYKLVIPDNADIENEKYAEVNIPVQLE